MSDSVDFDFSELNRLVADLGEAPKKSIPKIRQAVEVSARNVKDAARETAKAASGSHARRYPGSIDYDMKLDTDGEIGAEIGPNLGKSQGALGFLEDAPGGVKAKPQHALRDASKETEKDFIKGILLATEGDL